MCLCGELTLAGRPEPHRGVLNSCRTLSNQTRAAQPPLTASERDSDMMGAAHWEDLSAISPSKTQQSERRAGGSRCFVAAAESREGRG